MIITDGFVESVIFNLDPLIPVFASLYPPIGRPAEIQVEIFHSFVLMMHTNTPLDRWIETFSYNPVLCVIAGFTLDNLPKTSSYYDFINRIVLLDDHPNVIPPSFKPTKKLKKGEKQPPKNKYVVTKIVNRIISNENKFFKRLYRRPERFLQRIFVRVAVDASIALGFVPESVSASGNGTCMRTAACSYGGKNAI